MGYDKSFIEVQFPVSKISKESYKERKANLGQTLTGLGKWWGRKPLILVRATILGLVLPATNNPEKDREVFLKLLTMDDEGLFKRKNKSITAKEIYNFLNDIDKQKYFMVNSKGVPQYAKGVIREVKERLQKLYFNSLSYDKKIMLCCRPEEVNDVISKSEWDNINKYLGTNSNSLNELIRELGEKKFGHNVIVGDCFAGGGSIPFEASRIGCESYASDLNPIAALLTWSALNIAGLSANKLNDIKEFQNKVYSYIDNKILDMGIESNNEGHRADSYLYCSEVICPECGYKVPLAPSWIIGKGTKTVALLKDNGTDGFDIQVISDANKDIIELAESKITVKGQNIHCPKCNCDTSISVIRNDRKNNDGKMVYGLRKWEKEEFIPRKDDVFQEKLYCIRYNYIENIGGKKIKKRYYKTPDKNDFDNEEKVIEILSSKFNYWQDKGYIPTSIMDNITRQAQPSETRGWQYWHQLFNPRQLLLIGLYSEALHKFYTSKEELVVGILGINKFVNFNSKLSMWVNGSGVEKVVHVFTNQALNTFYNYGTRANIDLENLWFLNLKAWDIKTKNSVELCDARNNEKKCDIWITDPPYADAVNYHELSEFFLSWDKNLIKLAFPQWYCDTKRVLAIKGMGESFNDSMVQVYSNLASNMPENGRQVVMFTHSNTKVWAELAMILWSAGLQVTAAWNIGTETDAAGLKQGNYVKGTVLLILRKQTSTETAYLDELYAEIEEEVKYQIDSMRGLDDKEDPNFSDPDYLLAAYAASLKVLTSYKNIEDIDVKYELSKSRNSNEVSPIENIINQAVKIAYDYLIPSEFDSFIWKTLIPEERLYLKGIELEKQNLYQLSAYQELARGFGVSEYTMMLASTKANTARLKTPKEFGMKNLGDHSDFGNSLLRNILVAIYLGIKEEDTSKGRNWLKTEVPDYWNRRSSIIEILNYLSKTEYIDNMNHWKECAHEAFILKNLVDNDNI